MSYYSNSDSSSEDDEQYQAKIGEKFKGGVYEIIRWLGNGTFSKVWLVKNLQDNNYYALKIQKESYSQEAIDEIKILKYYPGQFSKIKDKEASQEWDKLKQEIGCGSNNCVQLVDHFLHEIDCKGYYCMVMEILGPTLLELIHYYDQRKSKMSISLVKHITKQILIGLVYIHQICQVIHTDIKPENIMVVLNDRQLKQLINDGDEEIGLKKIKKGEKQEDVLIWNDSVLIPINTDMQFKLVDFGNACPFEDQYEEIQTQEYKSPEAIIQAKYFANTDVWSLACVIFEMLTNNYLFDPEGTDEESQTDDLLALMIEILGQPNLEFVKKGKRSFDYFEQNGELKRIKKLENVTLSNILIGEYQFIEEEAKEIEEMLKYSLVWDPNDRPQSIDLIKHKWLHL